MVWIWPQSLWSDHSFSACSEPQDRRLFRPLHSAPVARLDLVLYTVPLGPNDSSSQTQEGEMLPSQDSSPCAHFLITIIIIAFKGAVRDFFTISSQRRELSPTRTLKWPGRNRVQITCNTSSAYHVQVSCYVPLGTKGQLSY